MNPTPLDYRTPPPPDTKRPKWGMPPIAQGVMGFLAYWILGAPVVLLAFAAPVLGVVMLIALLVLCLVADGWGRWRSFVPGLMIGFLVSIALVGFCAVISH